MQFLLRHSLNHKRGQNFLMGLEVCSAKLTSPGTPVVYPGL